MSKNLIKSVVFLPVSGLLLTVLIILLFSPCVHATTIQVQLDRNPVKLNESFTLEFHADASVDGEPDFKVLEQNFEILNQTHGSQMTINNGHFSRNLQWRLILVPRRAGKQEIPPVQFGRDHSEAVTLLVESAGSASNPQGAHSVGVMLEVHASTHDPFVQSQVIYTVKVLRRMDFAAADLSEPKLEDALIERLGDDKHYQATRDGLNYEVIERIYAIFPQKSGKITIPALRLEAQIFDGSSARHGFFGSPTTRLERIDSESVELDVKPVPPAFNGKHWLPSEQLSLDDAWKPNLDQVKAGEPITRTLTLHARGTSLGLLPELNATPTNVDALRSYPDQPLLNEEKQAQGVISSRQEKIVYVPEKAGDFRIPAIEIPWWNVSTGKLEITRVPEQRLTVTGSGATAAQPVAPSTVAPQPAASGSETTAAIQSEPDKNIWFWLALAFGLGWIVTLLGIGVFRFKRKSPKHRPETPSKPPRGNEATSALKHACLGGDAAAARQAWLHWNHNQAEAYLRQLLQQRELAAELEQLDRCLYAKGDLPWNGSAFWAAFEIAQSRVKAASKPAGANNDDLAPLHL